MIDFSYRSMDDILPIISERTFISFLNLIFVRQSNGDTRLHLLSMTSFCLVYRRFDHQYGLPRGLIHKSMHALCMARPLSSPRRPSSLRKSVIYCLYVAPLQPLCSLCFCIGPRGWINKLYRSINRYAVCLIIFNGG